MKKILAMAAVAALAAGASAFAANPFADVSTSDWAYQAVSDLSDQGIVEGYPDGTFKGQTNITRYEMAQIVARLMAKEDQYNAEQRATIDKLAGEYADELDSLGVRVANLEKKVGNISWSGDTRMRYQSHYAGMEAGDTIAYDVPGFETAGEELDTQKANLLKSLGYSASDLANTKKTKDTFDARFRLNMKAQVNDDVTVLGRLKTSFNFQDGDSADVEMDRLHVLYTPSEKFSLDLGRTSLWLGQTGILYDDTFDGVIAKYNAGAVGIEAGYGREKGFNDSFNSSLLWKDNSSKETWYAKVTGNVSDNVELSAFYQEFTQEFNSDALAVLNKAGYNKSEDNSAALWGAGAAFHFGKFTVDGDYIQNTKSYRIDAGQNNTVLDKPVLWTAGFNYGGVDTDKTGSYVVSLHYVDAEAGSYFGSSTLDITDMLDYSFLTNGAKFWVARAGVALAKGVELDAYYNFSAETQDGHDMDDLFGVELNYAF